MMDAQALLETIEKHLTSGFVWTQETGMSEHPAQVALANLRAYIATQQTLLEQAQAVASQQQATLEKVQRANGDLTKTLTLAYITMRINLADEVGECPIDTTGIARVLSAFNPNYKADYDEWFYRDVTP